jgi:hypothetical protein
MMWFLVNESRKGVDQRLQLTSLGVSLCMKTVTMYLVLLGCVGLIGLFMWGGPARAYIYMYLLP